MTSLNLLEQFGWDVLSLLLTFAVLLICGLLLKPPASWFQSRWGTGRVWQRYHAGHAMLNPRNIMVGKYYKGVHLGMVEALMTAIRIDGWDANSILIVKETATGNYEVVDGVHRVLALQRLLETQQLPADCRVLAEVVTHDTPEALLHIIASPSKQATNEIQ